MRSFATSLSILALVFIFSALPAFFSANYADAVVVLSNLVYILPITVSYLAQMFDFVLVITICAIFSVFYHSCRSYSFCFHLDERHFESIDVAYSWYLLLTLVSYFALGKRFLHAAPLHVALITWGSHAHCSDDYDCRSYKAVVVAIYFAFVLLRAIRDPRLYDVVDVTIAMFLFILAVSLYLFFNSVAGHTMWHVISAIGTSFMITCFRDSKFHTLGFRESKISYKKILRTDI